MRRLTKCMYCFSIIKFDFIDGKIFMDESPQDM